MTKEVKWNWETKDFDLFLDGHWVGSADSPSEAQRRLDEMAQAALVHQARLTPVVQSRARSDGRAGPYPHYTGTTGALTRAIDTGRGTAEEMEMTSATMTINFGLTVSP